MTISPEYILISLDTLSGMKSGENYLEQKKKSLSRQFIECYFTAALFPQSH